MKSLNKQFRSLVNMRINLEKFLDEVKTDDMGLSKKQLIALKKEYKELHNKIDKLTIELVIHVI